MKHKLIGYAKLSDFSEMPKEDIKALDVINIAFGHLREGRVECDCEAYLSAMERIRNENPEIKIVLSIGGWSVGGFSEAAYTEEGRRLFAESSADTIEKWGLDGIDIDWEYPCIGVAGIGSSHEDKENFTKLIRTIREEFDRREQQKHYSLTIAAGGDSYFTRCTQMDQVQKYLDYVQIMTYDMRGGFSVVTGHHTNLYTNLADLSNASVDYAVNCFVQAGVPYEKLVIGAAFYSRMWKGVPNREHGLMQAAESTGGYGPGYGDLKENYINKNGYTRYWDDEAKAPYLFNGTNFISYEDKESLSCKAKYVKEKGILGIMYWEYCLDTAKELTQYMKKELSEN